MKTIFCTLLASLTIVTSASAVPHLIVDTMVTETDANGKDTLLGHFHQVTKNGKQIVMPVGKFRYAVTPVLHENGTVDVVSTYTHPNYTGKDVMLGPEKQTAPLGQRSDISYGAITYSTKVLKAR